MAWLGKKPADVVASAQTLADGTVTSSKIQDGAVSTAKFADGAVTSAKVADGAITSSKFASNAVTSDKLADGAVGNTKIADGAITTGKIADGAVATADIADGAVTASKMASGAAAANLGFTPASSSSTVNLTGDQTIGGTKTFTSGVRFNDGTVQSTAAGAVTTSAVLSATAGATAGAVGSYTVFSQYSTGSTSVGQTVSGSQLRGLDGGGNLYSPGFSGTWRNMGCSVATASGFYLAQTLFVRIS